MTIQDLVDALTWAAIVCMGIVALLCLMALLSRSTNLEEGPRC